MEGHSDGTAGPLSYVIVVWWDKDASLYGFLTCFKDTRSGCEVRGTAHWDRDKLVNDYEEVVDGKKLRFRDTSAGTLCEPVITSKAVRRSKY
jgi:hypothetical protein